MTDWMPWGFVLMVGTFATLALTLRGLQRATPGTAPDLRNAWRSLLLTGAATTAVYLLYVLFAERWLWY